MRAEFLVPENNPAKNPLHDPYTESGARSIVRRFKSDVIAMLEEMYDNEEKFESGKTFLAQSPLKSKPWVAAAMKTLGWVKERPSDNGACALVMTEKARGQLSRLTQW